MERFSADIRNFAFGGAAYGVLSSGKGCFVRGAAPGENVTVEPVSEHARFIRAKLIKVNTPSADRIIPACPMAETCPGCSFGHISYEAEIFWKQKILEHFLIDSKCVDPEAVLPAVPAPERFFWRNKIRLAVENGCCGYRGEDNVSLLPVKKCLLVNEELNRMLEQLEPGNENSVELRHMPTDGVIRLTAGNRDQIIYDTLPGYGNFPVPAGAFFQTNVQVASLLVSAVVDLIRSSGIRQLIELHCGAGMFSICSAMQIPDLTTSGAEITAGSIRCARLAAEQKGVEKRCRFTASDAASFYRRQKNCRLLLVDPPRGGLDRKLLENICRRPPECMIYVSCSPDTLQRDMKALIRTGAKVVSSRLFDMFPCTAHFETVSLFSWKDSPQAAGN